MRPWSYRTTASARGRWFCVLAVALGAPQWGLAGEADAWVLRGTLVVGEDGGYAIVGRPDAGQQQWHAVGSVLTSDTRLIAVATDHAVVERAGERRRLDFGAKLNAEPPAVNRAFHIERLRIPELAEIVEIIPHRQQGRIVGFYVNGVPEDVRAEIGLQPGDLLRQVNGVPLDDRVDASQFYQLISTDRIDLEVTRKGVPVQLVYHVGQTGS